jgi:hypothetical protein
MYEALTAVDYAAQVIIGFPSIYICLFMVDRGSEMFGNGAGFIKDEGEVV